MGELGGTQSDEVTALLSSWGGEEGADALRRLMPLVLEELRRLARSHLRREREEHTLQPTALVHEVYLRLAQQRAVSWENRAEFFAFASTLMRRILIDYAKARATAKRGGDLHKVSLDDALGVAAPTVDLLALDEALVRLQSIDPRLVQIIELRYFAGLSHEQVAEALGISRTTVKRSWQAAKLWLYRELHSSDQPDNGHSDQCSAPGTAASSSED